MEIRSARVQDQETIVNLVHRAHLNPMDLQWQRFLVAEDEMGIVGVGQIRPHRDARELSSLVVREDQRGNGIGEQLVNTLITQSPGTLYLFCRSQLESYYARFGFRAISVKEAPPSLRLRYAIGRFVTRLLMGKPMLMMKKTSKALETPRV